MKWTGRTLLLGIVAVGLGGCGPFSMERVPSAEQIEKIAGPLLIEADQIQGVYMNLDVDSIVFTYHTAVKTEEELAEALSSGLAGSRWERSTNVEDFLELRRSFAKGDTSKDRPDVAMLRVYNVCRLSFDPESGTVVVACGQSEGRWTEEVIWPKFDELRSKRPIDRPTQEKGNEAGAAGDKQEE